MLIAAPRPVQRELSIVTWKKSKKNMKKRTRERKRKRRETGGHTTAHQTHLVKSQNCMRALSVSIRAQRRGLSIWLASVRGQSAWRDNLAEIGSSGYLCNADLQSYL